MALKPTILVTRKLPAPVEAHFEGDYKPQVKGLISSIDCL